MERVEDGYGGGVADGSPMRNLCASNGSGGGRMTMHMTRVEQGELAAGSGPDDPPERDMSGGLEGVYKEESILSSLLSRHETRGHEPY